MGACVAACCMCTRTAQRGDPHSFFELRLRLSVRDRFDGRSESAGKRKKKRTARHGGFFLLGDCAAERWLGRRARAAIISKGRLAKTIYVWGATGKGCGYFSASGAKMAFVRLAVRPGEYSWDGETAHQFFLRGKDVVGICGTRSVLRWSFDAMKTSVACLSREATTPRAYERHEKGSCRICAYRSAWGRKDESVPRQLYQDRGCRHPRKRNQNAINILLVVALRRQATET